MWELRQVALELSGLVVLLLDVCTKEKCPQMKASDEWVFLCAAHRLPQEVCSIIDPKLKPMNRRQTLVEIIGKKD